MNIHPNRPDRKPVNLDKTATPACDENARTKKARHDGRAGALHGAYFTPAISPSALFQIAPQPGEDFSQTSAQAGNEALLTASRIRAWSAADTGTSLIAYFFTVVHGSLP